MIFLFLTSAKKSAFYPIMKTIVATIGCSCSGKSTWASNENNNISGFTDYISSDSIRKELFGDENNQSNGKLVFDTLYSRVVKSLQLDKTPIVDATHYNPKNRIGLESVAKQNDALIEWHYFPVSLNEACERNSNRERKAPEDIIKRQWLGLTLPEGNKVVWHGETNKVSLGSYEKFIICDLDGTIANRVTDRSPYDGDRVFEDEANQALLVVLGKMDSPQYKIIFFSAREDVGICRDETIRFLEVKCGIENPHLILRDTKDHRKDSLVKYEMFMKNITDKENVLLWFDDRDQVVEMVRNRLGVPCFQVNFGNF